MTASDEGYRPAEGTIGGAAGIVLMLLLLAGTIRGPAKAHSTNSPLSKILASVSAYSQQVARSDTWQSSAECSSSASSPSSPTDFGSHREPSS